MDRGAWWAAIHRVAKESDTTGQLNNNNWCKHEVGSVKLAPE